MKNINKVQNQAEIVNSIFNDYITKLPYEMKALYMASFHLRPTASESTTIVSTLPIAPMRGLNDVKPDNMTKILHEITQVLYENDKDIAQKLLDGFGFKKRDRNPLEERAQAALIRKIIMERFEKMTFVTSEFVLFGYGGVSEKISRADVIAYRDGILFDIELKVKRNGINVNNRKDSALTQAFDYTSHMKDPNNCEGYVDCLRAFPNGSIGAVKEICGIAVVEAAKTLPKGTLRTEAESISVELWNFKETENGDFTFDTNGR
jgi:hypothetical protein